VVGGSGFVGTRVCNSLRAEGLDFAVLSRFERAHFGSFMWDHSKKWIASLDLKSFDSVVYLAGLSLTEKRLTSERKLACEKSRIDGTRFLLECFQKANAKLSCFIGASATGYYGSALTDEVKNETCSPGSGWLAELCVKWEKESNAFKSISERTIVLRFPSILGIDGGFYPQQSSLARKGLAVALGTGHQPFPWIHVDDVALAIVKILQDRRFDGIFNCVAPQHVSNKEYTAELAKSVGKPYILPNAPGFIVRARMGSEIGDFLLGGSRISGEKLLQFGFRHKYPLLGKALQDLAIEDDVVRKEEENSK
jgi:uncharacterized protein (TIGR01777 family)